MAACPFPRSNAAGDPPRRPGVARAGNERRERWERAEGYAYDALESPGPTRSQRPRPRTLSEFPSPPSSAAIGAGLLDPDAALREQCHEDLGRLLELSAALDAPVVVVGAFGFSNALPPRFGTGRSPGADRELFAEGLAVLARAAERTGGSLVVEPLNRYETPVCNTVAEAIALARATGSGRIGVMADVFHLNIEEAEPLGALRDAAPLLRYVHLADSNRLEPGAGHLSFDEILRTLAAVEYDGYAALECRLSGPADEVLPRVAMRLRGALDPAHAA